MFFFSLFVDGIDGKQARRIGLSGPLGELFDHGNTLTHISHDYSDYNLMIHFRLGLLFSCNNSHLFVFNFWKIGNVSATN